MKKFLLLFLTLFLVGCGNYNEDEDDHIVDNDTLEAEVEEVPEVVVEDVPEVVMLNITLEELKMYNGIDNEMMYVAVDGVIYDVTGVEAWAEGNHNGAVAGTDVTDILPNSPHKEAVLEDLVIVGTIK